MKAPDKIFRTTTYLDNDKGKVVWKGTPVDGAENIAYIRKDALLEWMKNMKLICKGAEPIEKAYQTMINKIESL